MTKLLHNLIGHHTADPGLNQWDRGRFASACTTCGQATENLPGLNWKLKGKAGRA